MIEINKEKADKLGFNINYLILVIVVELTSIISLIKCMKFLLVKDFTEVNCWSNNSFRVNFIMALVFLLIAIVISIKPISDKFHHRALTRYTIKSTDSVRTINLDSRLEYTIFESIVINLIRVFIL